MPPPGTSEHGGSAVSPAWLVTSVSEALHASPNLPVATASYQRTTIHAHPCAFTVREGFPIIKERRPSWFGVPMENLAEQLAPDLGSCRGFSFQILGRRHPIHSHLLPPEIDVDVLDILDDSVLSGHVAGLLSQHVIPKVNGQVVAAKQQLERAGQWVGTRRLWLDNASSSFQHDSHSSSRQESPFMSAEAKRLEQLALTAQQQCNPELAASLYEELVRIQPNADNYARLSKQFTDLTYVPSIKAVREKVVEFNTKAVEVAHLAVATDPSRPLAHIARCVSRGRLALVSDNRTKVQLAKEAADDAAVALRLDPRNDLAHHLMGRWHYEMAQINAIARTLIRFIFGTSLMQGSFSEALVHYKTAAELCPARVIHRVELGRTLLKLGHREDAVQELVQALDLEIEDINAQLQQQDAALLLNKIQSQGVQGLFYGSPQPPAELCTGQGPRPTAV